MGVTNEAMTNRGRLVVGEGRISGLWWWDAWAKSRKWLPLLRRGIHFLTLKKLISIYLRSLPVEHCTKHYKSWKISWKVDIFANQKSLRFIFLSTNTIYQQLVGTICKSHETFLFVIPYIELLRINRTNNCTIIQINQIAVSIKISLIQHKYFEWF